MRTVAFKVSNENNLPVVLEVIKKFGFKPQLINDMPTKKKQVLSMIEIASKTPKRVLTPAAIDKIIADERQK